MPLLAVPAARSAGGVPLCSGFRASARLPPAAGEGSGTASTATGAAAATAVAGLSGCYGVVQCSWSAALRLLALLPDALSCWRCCSCCWVVGRRAARESPACLHSCRVSWCSDTELDSDGLAWRLSSSYELGAPRMCMTQLPVVWAPAAFDLLVSETATTS